MKLATTTAIILMLGATPLLASSERGAMAPMMPALDFEAADADGNGAITQDEWTAYLGDVMETRRAAMFDRRAEQMIEAGDSDGDGLLSREELVAEIGSALLCADLGIVPELEPRPDHAAYVGSWLTVLGDDKRAIFQAAAHAQRAVSFLHALQPAASDEREAA